MGAYRLNTFVHAVERPNGQTEARSATFGPGDALPDWALAAISNPDVWDGAAPPLPKEPESASTTGPDAADELARLRARVAELEHAAAPDGGTEPSTSIPPRGGPGSGAPEWREYARGRGVDVADDASRDDVIAALDAAGIPTK